MTVMGEGCLEQSEESGRRQRGIIIREELAGPREVSSVSR